MKKQVLAPGWHRETYAKITLSILSVILALCNILIITQRGDSLIRFIPLWLPFLVLPIFLIILQLKDVLFIASLFIGVTLTIVQDRVSDIQGITFFLIAYIIYNDKTSMIVIFFTMLVGVLGRSFLLSMSFYQTVGLFIGYSVCILILYFVKDIKDV